MGIGNRPRRTPRDLRESVFTAAVIELAQILGWRVAHFRPSRTVHGWRTAVQGDGAGFPDLSMVRDRVVIAELKTDARSSQPSEAQTIWLERFTAAGVEAYLWRPRDLEKIAAVLTSKGIEEK